MKARGMVQRIDDLGRVVIPKEIRKKMKIKNYDYLEIFSIHENEIIIKKYDDNRDIENWVEGIMEKYGNEVKGVHVNGKTITVYTSDGTFKATCSNSDEFKFNVGVAVALARAYDEEFPEQLES